MKVQPVASPHAIQPPTPHSTDKRAAAIKAFQQGRSSYDAPAPTPSTVQAQETPVANPNNISPEELSAVKPQAQETEVTPDISTQSEATPEPVKPEPKDPALSRQFAQLARQERQIRMKAQQQAQELQRQKEAFELEKKAWTEKQTDYEKNYVSRQVVKDNTLQALAEAGVSYDDLTQQILNQAPPNPQMEAYVKRLEAQINELKGGLDEQKKQQVTAQQEQRKAAERQIEVDATDLIRSNPVAYEAISQLGKRGIQEVKRLITQTYDKDGILMTVEQAADEVENYLVEENYNMASRISKIKKRLQGQDTQGKTATETKQTQPAPMKTLTNASASTRKLSAKERAILAFKGELK